MYYINLFNLISGKITLNVKSVLKISSLKPMITLSGLHYTNEKEEQCSKSGYSITKFQSTVWSGFSD